MVLSLRLTSVYLTTQMFDKFGDQEEYGHIEQDSARLHDPEKKRKKKENRPGTLSRGAALSTRRTILSRLHTYL